jgi:hypothetical protein
MDQQDYEAIERLAYQLWQERGSPIGSPDEDWFRTEAEMRRIGPTEDLRLFAVAMGPTES